MHSESQVLPHVFLREVAESLTSEYIVHHYFRDLANGDFMIDLSNQVALVTGGSRGIGAATALLLAKAGADVGIIYGKNFRAAAATVRQIREIGRTSESFHTQVENAREVKETVARMKKSFGRIDILVNSAGIWEYGEVGKMSVQEWNRSININLTGTFNMCNSVVPMMKRQRYGRIINISSTAGQRGEAFHSHYASSKGGVIAFTKSIAVELIEFGIWVNGVAPGWVDTDMVSSELQNLKKKRAISESIPRQKIATAEEIAGPVLFLASALSDHIVGEILNVNGGSVLCG